LALAAGRASFRPRADFTKCSALAAHGAPTAISALVDIASLEAGPYGPAVFELRGYPMYVLRLAALAAVLVTATAAQAQQGAAGPRPQGAAPAAPAAQGAPAAANVPKPRQEKVFDLDAQWVAVSLNGRAFSGDRPSFSIDKQYRARGFGGCRVFAATAYPLREQRLAVGPIALTKKTCDQAIMQQENTFLVAFRTSAQWDQQGSTLIIRTQNGELRFERAI
jgi:heat shock protein HslJ